MYLAIVIFLSKMNKQRDILITQLSQSNPIYFIGDLKFQILLCATLLP
jgi:hypothetical protein